MIPEAQKQQMAEAVAKIRETMAAAAKAAGRDPAEVRLCAACKTRTVEEVRYSADLPRFFAYAARVATRYRELKPLLALLEPMSGPLTQTGFTLR